MSPNFAKLVWSEHQSTKFCVSEIWFWHRTAKTIPNHLMLSRSDTQIHKLQNKGISRLFGCCMTQIAVKQYQTHWPCQHVSRRTWCTLFQPCSHSLKHLATIFYVCKSNHCFQESLAGFGKLWRHQISCNQSIFCGASEDERQGCTDSCKGFRTALQSRDRTWYRAGPCDTHTRGQWRAESSTDQCYEVSLYRRWTRHPDWLHWWNQQSWFSSQPQAAPGAWQFNLASSLGLIVPWLGQALELPVCRETLDTDQNVLVGHTGHQEGPCC